MAKRPKVTPAKRSEWGKQGNAARNAKLSPAERSAIARKAGLANAQRIKHLQAAEATLLLMASLKTSKANSAKQEDAK